MVLVIFVSYDGKGCMAAIFNLSGYCCFTADDVLPAPMCSSLVSEVKWKEGISYNEAVYVEVLRVLRKQRRNEIVQCGHAPLLRGWLTPFI